MTTEPKRPGFRRFHALDVALEIVGEMKNVVASVRRHDAELAKQLVRATSSIAANVAEGNRRVGRDRAHLFRVALGSADEVVAHLRVAQAWGWVEASEIEQALTLLDRELAMLFRLAR